MMAEGPVFTVFTPTYNRAHTLARLAESLESQTFRSFEWLVVDDGSSDGTGRVVERIAAGAGFPVRYVFKENGGKHSASNLAVRTATGRFFYTVDSDDVLKADALACLNAAWEAIPAAEQAGFAGVVALCEDEEGNVVGDTFPASPFDSSSGELLFKHRIKGEKSGFTRLDLMKATPFPEAEGVRFVPEGRVWLEIAKNYRLRAINKVVRQYCQDGGGQLTSLDRDQRAQGDEEYCGYLLSDQLRWLPAAPLEFVKAAIIYQKARRVRTRMRQKPMTERKVRMEGRALIALAWPLSFLSFEALARLAGRG